MALNLKFPEGVNMGKRLNQVVAIERDVKSKAYKDITKEHQLLQNVAVVQGMQRTYRPKEEDGEKFPSESKVVQARVPVALEELHERMRDLFDVTFTKDCGNQKTQATVEIDGTVVLKDVPVPTLLFLEKQLEDLHTFFTKLPTLPADEKWTWDGALSLWATEPQESVRTKKVKKAIVLYPHSTEHPAQTQLVDDDVIAGTWTTIKHSGAIPEDRRRELVRRCELLQRAVKDARERANMAEIQDVKMGDTVFKFLLGTT